MGPRVLYFNHSRNSHATPSSHSGFDPAEKAHLNGSWEFLLAGTVLLFWLSLAARCGGGDQSAVRVCPSAMGCAYNASLVSLFSASL